MKTTSYLFSALAGGLLASSAIAQNADVFLMDAEHDQLLRLADLDGDGSYLSANEASTFWNNGTAGATAVYPEHAAFRMETGTPVAYWLDGNAEYVYRGVDTDGNGLIDPGTADEVIFRDLSTEGGAALRGLTTTPDGGLWYCGGWAGSGTHVGIFRLEDLNGDGDGADVGESITYVLDGGPVTTPNAGGAVPVDAENFQTVTDMDNGVVAWTGYSGNFSDDFSIYRFEDLNGDGDVLDANEAINFLNATGKNPALDMNVDFQSGLLRDLETWDAGAPTGHGRLMKLATLNEGGKDVIYAATDASNTGTYSTNQSGLGINGLIFRCEDLNGDRDANDAGEVTLYFDGSHTSGDTFNKILGMAAEGSSVYVAALNNDTVIYRLQDLNGDGDAMDPGELFDNGGTGLWDPNTWGAAHGDYPVPYDVTYGNYHVFTLDIAAFGAGNFAAPAAGFNTSGVGCSQYSVEIPTIHGSGQAKIGASTFVTEMKNAPGGMPAAVTIGLNTDFWLGIPLPFDMAAFGWPGCNLYHDWQYTFWTVTTGAGPTDGVATMPLTVPNFPPLVGVDLAMQWAVLNLNPTGFDLGLTQLGTVTVVN